MRIVKGPEEFSAQLESAKNESLKAFDDDKMLVEKFVERPRWVANPKLFHINSELTVCNVRPSLKNVCFWSAAEWKYFFEVNQPAP